MREEKPKLGGYELRELTRLQLRAVEAQWTASAGAEEFEVELGAIFERYEAEVTSRGSDGYSVELYNEETGSTDAILEMVSGKRGALSKLLTLRLSPEFWNSGSSEAGREVVLRVYGAAFMHVIAQGVVSSDVDEVKIYGRNDVMLDILKGLGDLWGSDTLGWAASMEARWLVISRNTKS